MICKHCGKEIDDKAVLCVHCGKMVNEKPKLPTGLIVFLWIAFLPIMAIITIVKSKKFPKKNKIDFIGGCNHRYYIVWNNRCRFSCKY